MAESCLIQCGRTHDARAPWFCVNCSGAFIRAGFTPDDLEAVAWAVKRTRHFAYRRRGKPPHTRSSVK